LTPAVHTSRIIVAVPKTSMDEDHFAARAEHQVGLPRKSVKVQPIPVPQSMYQRANQQLGLHVFTLDPAHIFGTAVAGQEISHQTIFLASRNIAVCFGDVGLKEMNSSFVAGQSFSQSIRLRS
jgi:hypothetical protein